MSAAPRIRSQFTWDMARDAYLGGEPAAEVCRRFDLGLSAFRARARRCGWRRRDQPDPFVDDPDASLEAMDLDDDGDAPQPSGAGVAYSGASDLREVAWRRVRRAVDGGRVLEAKRWLAVLAELRPLATDEAYDVRRLAAEQEGDE